MATPAPVYRSQGNAPFRSERQNSQLKRGQTVPYDVNGAPSGGVPDTRLINTTAPLAGGGALSSDLTLTIGAATSGVRGTMSAADKTKLDAISGTNTGDQTITLTGPVTGSGTGTFGTTITNKAVTLAKMDDVATATVFYRKTAGTGVPEVQTLATLKTDLGLTGTNSGDQFTAMTSSRILGRKTAGFGAAEELTGTQATTLLDTFTSGLQGVAPASGGGTTNFLRADGSWAVPAGGSSFRGCLAYFSADGASTNYTVGNGILINFPSESYDTDSIHGLAATVTITIASPGVVTWTGHNFLAGSPIILSTTGALPTGLVAGTLYYVVSPAANTFQLAATPGGAAINTSGSQSGTHTATNNSRLTVPSGVTKVRLRAQASHNGTGTSGNAITGYIYKNGSNAYPGSPRGFIETTTLSGTAVAVSPTLSVTAGDYFEFLFNSESDTSIILIADQTWFSMEIVE